jgi:hypothetical protein
MALTQQQKRSRNAGYQARWRAKRDALARTNPEVSERALMQAAERCERLSDQERTALADKLTDIAMRHLWRSHELSRIATKVRTGGR